MKGHRAYLYEVISPLRLESTRLDGSQYCGFPLRRRLSQEKESGFYVDFVQTANAFIAPAAGLTSEQAGLRISTLVYLLITADAVRRVILDDDTAFRFGVFGELAYRICSEVVYQQEMPQITIELRQRSERHRKMFSDLDVALQGNEAFLKSTFVKGTD